MSIKLFNTLYFILLIKRSIIDFMALKTFIDVEEFLDSFSYIDKSNPPGLIRKSRLERMVGLLNWIGNPQDSFKSIHLAGSKGKGSTATFISTLLEAKGYKAGLYLSPHVSDFRERFTLAGSYFSDDFYILVANKLQTLVEGYKNDSSLGQEKPTTFEMYTAYSYLLFKEYGCDYCVIETGLGGRLDATNTLNSIASVITPIELEHTSVLGDSVEKIAIEKSKIIKESQVVFSSKQDKEALSVIQSECSNQNSTLYTFDDNILDFSSIISEKGERVSFTLNDKKYDLQLSVFTEKQGENVALAILVADKLGFLSDEGIKRIEKATIKGRFTRLKINNVDVVIDVAHTQKSILDTVETFKTIFNASTVIFGAVEGKDITHMLKILLDSFSHLIISQPGTFKKSDIEEIFKIAKEINPNKDIKLIKDNEEALSYSIDRKAPILITGSFYLAGPMINILEDKYGVKC